MIKIRFFAVTVLTVFVIPAQITLGWGFTAHMRINADAVDTLPAEMKGFYNKHRAFISEHAVDPDKWKSTDKKEFPRHFIDLDLYGTYPFKELPRDYDEAVEKFTAEVVISSGTLPWRIVEYTKKLAEDMKKGNVEDIRMTSAALGHYVGDAHSPLHSAENYNGQFTNNFGIHKQFESNMVNSKMEEYNYTNSSATPIDEPLQAAFDILMHSYKVFPLILKADTKARNILTASEIDSLVDWRAGQIPKYLDKLHADVGDLGWKQMNSASINLGKYWVTAWEMAGRPTLPQ